MIPTVRTATPTSPPVWQGPRVVRCDRRAWRTRRVSDPVPGMRRLAPLVLALALAAAPAAAAPPKVTAVAPPPPTGATEVVPGLTYQRVQQPGPQVVNVLRLTRGSPLLTLAPVLTAGTPAKRGSLTGYVHATLDAGSVAAVNGDLFNLQQAFPSGILVQGGV